MSIYFQKEIQAEHQMCLLVIKQITLEEVFEFTFKWKF